ncbi:unnamed protein product [Lactuca saligna]|uniref:Uncharacterized protein n=1 Tax=Lactuca saligna TaxID=75948 RepID=A0AA36DXS5_LACSI|nr:unnamed protein product [Lactuca saligna]
MLDEADQPKKGGKKTGMKAVFKDFSVPSPIATILTPITIPLCPTVSLGVLQVQTSFFSDSTTTITTFFVDPLVTINASDVGAGASGFTAGHLTPPVSPFHHDDPAMIYGDDDEDFEGFAYSPFKIWTKSDDEAPVTKGKLKAINEKLDSLPQASKASSTDDYSQASM